MGRSACSTVMATSSGGLRPRRRSTISGGGSDIHSRQGCFTRFGRRQDFHSDGRLQAVSYSQGWISFTLVHQPQAETGGRGDVSNGGTPDQGVCVSTWVAHLP